MWSLHVVSDPATAPRESVFTARVVTSPICFVEEVRSWLTQWPAAMAVYWRSVAGSQLSFTATPRKNHDHFLNHIFKPVFFYFIYAFFAL